MEAIFPLWSNSIFDFGPTNIGTVFFVLGFIGVVIQGGLIGPMTKLIGERKLVQIASVSVALGLILIGLSLDEVTLWIGLFFYGMGAAIFNPSLSSLISKSAKPYERGKFLGQYQSASAMGRIIGPAFSGVLYANFIASAPLYLGAIVVLPIIVVIANFSLRKPI